MDQRESNDSARWRPISKEELEDLINEQLSECTPEMKRVFATCRTPLRRVPIERGGVVEEVFVVATLPNGAMYYDDVEEGFEVSPLRPDGGIATPGCSQLRLMHVLHGLTHEKSGTPSQDRITQSGD